MSKLSSRKNINSDNYLLIGSPNVGKSTIFNRLTHSTSIVSNIDRMTTEHTIGKIKKTDSYLIDLPGVYNLSHPIAEENETSYHLLHGKVDGIVNVISAFSIQRDLYLTLQCIETGLLNTLTINMIDLINPKSINWKKLSHKLNDVNIVLTRSNRNKNINDVVKSIKLNKHVDPKIIKYSKEIESNISKIEALLPNLVISKRFVALMILEKNDYFIDQIKKHHPYFEKTMNDIVTSLKNTNYIEEIREAKYLFIKNLLKDCGYDDKKYVKLNISKQEKFDHYFLKKWIGIPIFIIIALAIYYLAFGNYAGGWLQKNFGDWLTNQVGGVWITNWFNAMHAPDWCTSLFRDGIFGGLFIVLPFIVTIAILYFLITVIQQIGLLSRVSVLLDNALSKFGLSGRSVVNLLTGFGCSVPAVMLARSSSSKKERIISVLITPFVACTTRVIVLSAISQTVFGSLAWLSTFGLVFASGLIALLIGLTFSNILFRKQKSFFCVEMVNWNGLDLKIIFKSVWLQIKEFLKKAVLIVIAANIVIWVLVHIGPWGYVDIKDVNKSFLYYIGYGLSYPMYPVFGTAGANGWKLSASLIAGLPAKEIILTTLNQVTANNIGSLFAGQFGKALAMSFMVFMMFYLPCIPTINVMRKEVNKKHFFMNLGVSFATAYLLGTLTYWIGYSFCLI